MLVEPSTSEQNTVNIITPIEQNLKALTTLIGSESTDDEWKMQISLFYKNTPAGMLSFTLNGYTLEEAEELVHNLRNNEFLMKEIDDFLWGESD